MTTRREFLRFASALGAFTTLGGGAALLSGCELREVPGAIDNTGTRNVSAALTNWLATGSPGDVFRLRRRPNGSPGRYWVPQGVRIGQSMVFDLNGCELVTGLVLGADDPDFESSRVAYPALWDDCGAQSDPDYQSGPAQGRTWPRQRHTLLIAASGVMVTSTTPVARIQGAARQVSYRSPGVIGRIGSTGCEYVSQLEEQHAIRVGGSAGAHSDANPYQNITIDLNDISLEFVHGDGVYLGDNHRNITIIGHNLGQSVIGGTVHDTNSISGYDGQGGDIIEGETFADDRWEPWDVPLPGIHHTGRQGIATDFRNYDTLIEGVALWRIRRSCIVWEPAAPYSEIINPTVRGIETGICQLRWMPCAGDAGPIDGLVVEDTVNYEIASISTVPSSGTATNRHANWRLQNNRCLAGVRGKEIDTIFNLQRIDGVEILDNEIPMTIAGQGLDVTDSTDVTIGPAATVQFPAG
ncbi:MAG TPA: hypothetical protein VFZ77_07940 [Acidimicrobiales bacterium]